MTETALYKQLFLLQRIIKGNLYVSINTSRLGVVLPSFLYDRPSVPLQIGLWMNNPIKELDVNDEGIRAVLSFNQSDFFAMGFRMADHSRGIRG